MPNLFNADFKDFLQALSITQVDYILAGDMDIWVTCTSENYEKLQLAFRAFGMPMFDISLEKFLYDERWDVFRFGRKPVAIDIMTKVNRLNFEETFKESEIRIIDDMPVRLIQYHHLIIAKKQA